MLFPIKRSQSVFLATLALFSLSSCKGMSGEVGDILGTDEVEERGFDETPADPVDPGNDGTGDTGDGDTRVDAPAIGDSCVSDDASKICLGLRYVVYRSADGTSASDDASVLENLRVMNSIWASCNIQFQVDELLYADPAEKGLLFNPTTQSQLTSVRQAYETNSTLLLVTTGLWAGSLGSGSANAWATMPGGSPNGVVLESAVHDYSNIYAHEIGHSLNLDHYGATSNVMSSVIYTSSNTLTSGQCTEAQDAIDSWMTRMMR